MVFELLLNDVVDISFEAESDGCLYLNVESLYSYGCCYHLMNVYYEEDGASMCWEG